MNNQPESFIDGVDHAPLDPFRGYANAIHDGLPDAVAVLDAFHVVRLGTQVVDEVRRRVQQHTLGRRGHKHDPLYQIRGLLRHGVEHLTERQQAKISACLDAGQPSEEVNVAWQRYQQLRAIYHAVPAKGRQIAIKVLDSFPAAVGGKPWNWDCRYIERTEPLGPAGGHKDELNVQRLRRETRR